MTDDQFDAFVDDAIVDMAVKLRTCLEGAWRRFEELPPKHVASFGVRSRSSVVHDFLTEAIESEFAQDKHAVFFEDRGLKQIAHGNVLIRFKKVNRRGFVARNKTRRSEQWLQLPVPGIDAQVRLSFVYRPDRLWTKIELAGLARQIGDSVVWFLTVGPVEGRDDSTEGFPVAAATRGVRLNRRVLMERQAELSGEASDEHSQIG